MQTIGKFEKTPTEIKRYEIDYSQWLNTNETLSVVTFEVTPTTDTPLVVLEYVIDLAGTDILMFIGGGEDGQKYEVVCTAATSTGQVKQDKVSMSVKL